MINLPNPNQKPPRKSIAEENREREEAAMKIYRENTGDTPPPPKPPNPEEEKRIRKLTLAEYENQVRQKNFDALVRECPVETKTYRLGAEMCPEPFFSASALKQLDTEFTAKNRLVDTAERYNPTNAVKAYKDAELKRQQAMVLGTDGSGDAWSREDWVEDFASNMRAAKVARREVEKRIEELTRPAIEKLQKWFLELAENETKAEKAEFERFGVTYTPSRLTITLRAAAYRLGQRLKSSAALNSAETLQLFGIIKK